MPPLTDREKTKVQLLKKVEEMPHESTILEQKQTEENLHPRIRALEEELATLKTRHRQIVQQERLCAIGEVVSDIAHNFNNVLTPILGFTELLLNSAETLKDEEKVIRYLQMINTSAQDAAATVRRLCNFYRDSADGETFELIYPNSFVMQPIDIESEQGSGTTVTLQFSSTAELQKADGRGAGEAPARSLRVLVVDDNPLVSEAIALYLAGDGHTVEVAANGREGLEKFQTAPFDLVILDRSMPVMNGTELASTLKRIAPHTPVILLTSFGDLMEARGERPANIDAIVSKPITLTQFRAVLTKFVR